MSMTIPSPTASTENPLSPESDEGAFPSIIYLELEAPAGIEQPFFGKAIESPGGNAYNSGRADVTSFNIASRFAMARLECVE
jgi:hypothetical protein